MALRLELYCLYYLRLDWLSDYNLNTPQGFSVPVMSEASSEGELVRLALEGDEHAFGNLVELYQRAAYAVAYSVTGRHEDAEDAAQESFLVALERLEECRNPDRFGGWLMTIVRNRSKNLIRRESLRETDEIPMGATSRSPMPDRVVENIQIRETLEGALRKLPEVQRQIVLLHDLEGWKHREIADRLGLPSGTVRSHLHFARKALRVELGSSPLGVEKRRKVQ
ncbi:MAG: sigma-70 family RNA polymerase sigma factor [Gemmatimonadota bacterium]|nr:sigma-70 family RNA polymerase sigma factor [Gemmatimonadota bacterium]